MTSGASLQRWRSPAAKRIRARSVEGQSAKLERAVDARKQIVAFLALTLVFTAISAGPEEWYARPPFPAVHTHTYDFELISQGGFENYVLHMTMHETVNANGVPTATVDNFSMDCQG
jgi:hypothetical protein